MLHRLADGLRRFFKFSSGKNRLPVQPFARPVSGQEGIEKISEGDKCEPKGSQKSFNFIALPRILGYCIIVYNVFPFVTITKFSVSRFIMKTDAKKKYTIHQLIVRWSEIQIGRNNILH